VNRRKQEEEKEEKKEKSEWSRGTEWKKRGREQNWVEGL